MPSVEKFRESLADFLVDERAIAQVNDGFEDVSGKSPKKRRAAYFGHAMEILEKHMDKESLCEMFESHACCKGGARLKASKAFAREYAGRTVAERLSLISSVPNMGVPVLNRDGTITVNAVSYLRDGKYLCACPNFNGAKYEGSVSRSYCYCCAGHFRFHYEIMLEVKLKTMEIVSSPLDSSGANPCVLRFAFEDSAAKG